MSNAHTPVDDAGVLVLAAWRDALDALEALRPVVRKAGRSVKVLDSAKRRAPGVQALLERYAGCIGLSNHPALVRPARPAAVGAVGYAHAATHLCTALAQALDDALRWCVSAERTDGPLEDVMFDIWERAQMHLCWGADVGAWLRNDSMRTEAEATGVIEYWIVLKKGGIHLQHGGLAGIQAAHAAGMPPDYLRAALPGYIYEDPEHRGLAWRPLIRAYRDGIPVEFLTATF